MNNTDITLGAVAAHMLGRGEDGLRLSSALLDTSTPQVHDYITDYLATADASAHTRIAAFDENASVVAGEDVDSWLSNDGGATRLDVKSLCSRYFEAPDADLLVYSRWFARRLHRITSEDGRISTSVLLMCEVTVGDVPQLAILKLEPNDGLQPHFEDGRLVFEVAEDVMPRSDQALQKCAFIYPSGAYDDFDLRVLDRQASSHTVAHFFVSTFLQADLAIDDAQRTKELVRAWTKAMNVLRDTQSGDEQRRTYEFYRDSLNRSHINLDDYVGTLHLPDEQREALGVVFGEMVSDHAFDIDRAVAERALRKRTFEGDHGLKVELRADYYDQMVQVREVPDSDELIIEIRTSTWKES